MRDILKNYIDGAWVASAGVDTRDIINPATGQVSGRMALSTAEDVKRAVAVARQAFAGYSRTSVEERATLLNRIAEVHEARAEDMAQAVTLDIGMPIAFARMTVGAGTGQFRFLAKAIGDYPFALVQGGTRIVKEPIGVAGLIPPWNYPSLQSAEKIAPALAAGCTMILKPGTPYTNQVLAEILDEAGVPKGVFNLVNGRGSVIGMAFSRHPDVDMIAFTGSTGVGIQVQKDAAETVKRVSLELGGKSPHIILPDADFEAAAKGAVAKVMSNSGQTCAAPTRTLVPRAHKAELEAMIRTAAEAIRVGDPLTDVDMGPVANEAQWHTVQRYIQSGIDEGATLLAGGPGHPEVADEGWFARPTVFADVRNDMTVAREEIFGPVMSLIAYDTVDEAVEIANDTPYGLAAYVDGSDDKTVQDVASRLRAGQVILNGAQPDLQAPFGGYKQSGNGRIWGLAGLEEYLETKAIVGV
ncbi:aldehyde dehydrogenase family protein [Beijerinckia indica]|uniref:Aldehyde Dehydrogenase n=1 Tax=Beijerinckia indica subsp. indica (strain ATCC 9039 / DSM 1715 / NCIMB 8712) TaxID=395963 RepID=B2IB00_BEII9|nr:aldehyde dehydrogenase family protein [Beijerinckia indica]ACB93700.1 Aldehyde Dehydrogenase [Beijerinckia indica subsp. indica ATCC 9039]